MNLGLEKQQSNQQKYQTKWNKIDLPYYVGISDWLLCGLEAGLFADLCWNSKNPMPLIT